MRICWVSQTGVVVKKDDWEDRPLHCPWTAVMFSPWYYLSFQNNSLFKKVSPNKINMQIFSKTAAYDDEFSSLRKGRSVKLRSNFFSSRSTHEIFIVYFFNWSLSLLFDHSTQLNLRTWPNVNSEVHALAQLFIQNVAVPLRFLFEICKA